MRPMIRPGTRHERVFPLTSIEVRAAADGEPAHIVGHAAVYNRWSVDLGGFKERVMPGAFGKSIGVSDVRALFNHDPNYILGRTASGTCTLSDQVQGLKFDTVPPDTQTVRDLVMVPIGRGDINQCSFSFSVRDNGDVWREPKAAGGLWERDLLDVELYDVSVVTFPAYPQTDAVVRSLLAETGIDLDALTACLARTGRGLPLLESDRDLVTGSIGVLRSLLPPEGNGEEPSATNPEDGSHQAAAPAAGVTRAQLLRDLEHRLRIDQTTLQN